MKLKGNTFLAKENKLENKELIKNIGFIINNAHEDTGAGENYSVNLDLQLLCDRIVDFIENEISQRDTNKELLDYLVIAQPSDLQQLAFEYACDERWELLAFVVVELRNRIKAYDPQKDDIEYTDKYVEYLNEEIKLNFDIADTWIKESKILLAQHRECRARALVDVRDHYLHWKQTGNIEYNDVAG